MTNTETDRVKRLRDLAEHWHGHEASGFFAGCADEIGRLQLRESQARAILEPLAEHDPAIRKWLKGLPVDTQIEALTRRAEAAEAALDMMHTIDNLTPEQVAKLNERLNIGRVALSGEPPSPAEPTAKLAYHETHEAPHCPTCSCGAEKEGEPSENSKDAARYRWLLKQNNADYILASCSRDDKGSADKWIDGYMQRDAERTSGDGS